ncbi:hypothetical protein ACTUSQ_06815 [Pantoea ananatis]|uniref:hypothetical protein n=1 Tax=Pantoea ananas TaxID=553 RepID=UPI003FA4A389
MRKFLLVAGLMFATSSYAAFQCGGFRLTLNDAEGRIRVNGELVTSQKVKYLGAQGDEANTKWDMGLMPASDGNNYGFQFIKRDGKSWLNVQLLQASMDAPRVIGSFPCVKVDG